jgi:hypothetical protein
MKTICTFLIILILMTTNISATALGDAVSQMQPKSWRALFTNGIETGMFRIGVKNEPIFVFANDGVWDPHTEQIMFLGAPHQYPWVWSFVIYDAATNNWRSGNLDPYLLPNVTSTHTYDNLTLKYETGEVFFWSTSPQLIKYTPATDKWSGVSASNTSALSGPYSAMNYFPELNGLVYVNAGAVALYDFNTNGWKSLGSRSMGGIHNIGEYNPVHKVMVLGGGAGSNQLYKLDANGTLTTLKPAPFVIEVAQNLFTCDPVTGDYLLLREDSLWAYDVTTDTWASVAKNPISGFRAHWAVTIPISTYGVVAFLTNYQWPVLLYKHANGPAQVADKPDKDIFNKSGMAIKAFPNPFNPAVNIQIKGQAAANASTPHSPRLEGGFPHALAVFDVNGRFIKDLSAHLDRSSLTATWHAADVPPGIYILKLTVGNRTITKKLFLQR